MGRSPLPLGSWGLIRMLPVGQPGERPNRFRAFTQYRDYDGRTRQVEAWGRTKSSAQQNLSEATEPIDGGA